MAPSTAGRTYPALMVTSMTYSRARFAEEAKEIGVSRNVPIRFLHGAGANGTGLNWGTDVLVADFVGRRVVKKDRPMRAGGLVVFGAFTLDRIFVRGATGAYLSRLKVVGTDDALEGTMVVRACGKVTLDVAHVVQSTLAEVVEAIMETEPQAKVMIGGTYRDLHEFEVRGTSFNIAPFWVTVTPADAIEEGHTPREAVAEKVGEIDGREDVNGTVVRVGSYERAPKPRRKKAKKGGEK